MGSAAGLGLWREIVALPRFWAGAMAPIPPPSVLNTEPPATSGRDRVLR
jgi:hypothetical protein